MDKSYIVIFAVLSIVITAGCIGEKPPGPQMTISPENTPMLEILSDYIHKGPEDTHIGGTFTYNGDEYVKDVEITATLYDDTGMVITTLTQDSVTHTLESWETEQFLIPVTPYKDNMAHYSLNITGTPTNESCLCD